MHSVAIRLPATTTEAELLETVDQLNADALTVTGRTIAENLKSVKWNPHQDVVRSADKPITVTGDSAARASLAGKWVGEYSSPATGRSGSIVFNLSPTGDAASGDVLMVPREYGKALTPYATTTTGGVPIQNPGSASQVLTIKLVRVAGDTATVDSALLGQRFAADE